MKKIQKMAILFDSLKIFSLLMIGFLSPFIIFVALENVFN